MYLDGFHIIQTWLTIGKLYTYAYASTSSWHILIDISGPQPHRIMDKHVMKRGSCGSLPNPVASRSKKTTVLPPDVCRGRERGHWSQVNTAGFRVGPLLGLLDVITLSNNNTI